MFEPGGVPICLPDSVDMLRSAVLGPCGHHNLQKPDPATVHVMHRMGISAVCPGEDCALKNVFKKCVTPELNMLALVGGV